jgi:hypothetical protein
MTNKNPFEIRSEMLAMAKDYLDQQWQMNLSFTQQMFEQGQKTAEDMQKALTPYTIEDITEKAKELYTFVSKKD